MTGSDGHDGLLGTVTAPLNPILSELGLGGNGEGGGLIGTVTAPLDPILSGLGLGTGEGDGNGNGLLGLGNLDIGPDGLLKPVADTLNDVGDEAHGLLGNVLDQLDLSHTGDALTQLTSSTGLGSIGETGSNGESNLLTDVLSLPNDVLHGDDPVGAVGQIVEDVGDVVGNGHLGALADGIQADGVFPLLDLSADGDNTSGAKHLADVDIGPQQNDGLVANVIAPEDDGTHHAIEANVVKVAPDGPQLVNADLLNSSDQFQFPNLGGLGTDGLVGALTGGSSGGEDAGHAGESGGLLDLNALVDIAGVGGAEGQAQGHADDGIANLLNDTLHGHVLGVA